MKLSSLHIVSHAPLTSLALTLWAAQTHAQPQPQAQAEPDAPPAVEATTEAPEQPAEATETAAAPPAEAAPPATAAEPEPPAAAADANPPETAPVPEPAAAAAVPAAEAPPAPAEKPSLTVGGSIWSRYEVRENYATHGLSHPRLHREGDYVVSRARLVLQTPAVDAGDGVQVSGTFVPQAAYTWGEQGGAATITDDPPIALYEGYFSIFSESARLEAGRFALNYGDALVIGNLGWNESARSFNGARARFTPTATPAFIDLFATVVTEGRSTTGEALFGDVYFWGAYAGLGPLVSEGFDLDFYFLGQTYGYTGNIAVTDPMDPTMTALGEREDATELTLGSRVKGKADIIDYRVEAGIQFGKSKVEPTYALLDPDPQSKFAYQADAELGLAPGGGFRVGLEGLVASGDDLATTDKQEGYNELYPTGHKFLGFSDVIGPRTNVASGVLHLSYAATEALKLGLDAHYFSRLQAGADGKDGAIGTEFDTSVGYAIGQGASIRGMYALFLPKEEYWESKPNVDPDAVGDAIQYFELQLGYDFK